ncbi:MAG: SRPBCC family protein [Chloroflexi bacterium]|nr:SRPBCC family protein [Chloroflexota bacterium]
MTILEFSTQVSKPVEAVFEFITNLENQKKLSQYITAIEVNEPLKVGTRYKIQTTTMGRTIDTMNEVVAFEPNKKFGVKTFAPPPASDVTNTYVLEPNGDGTKLTMQVDAVLTPPGMPKMPGIEDMMKKQMSTAFEATLATMKKAIEG